VLQGYQGQRGEIVMFRRQTNDPVEVSLEYTDPELGQITRFAPVPLQVCSDAALPPPPPSKRPRRRSYRRRRPSRLWRFPSPFRCHAA
jgi:hypothetical protein